jgi:acyl-CoA reductase-like NAD-dependent aldehyde dehydrogenase
MVITGWQRLRNAERFVLMAIGAPPAEWHGCDEGRKARARVVHPSACSPAFDGSFYVSARIFGDVSPDQRIGGVEISGPVLSVFTFGEEAEALSVANDTVYGLSAIGWTRDIAPAHRTALGKEVGWTIINATDATGGGPPPGAQPMGGHRQSGFGVEGGVEGLATYLTSPSAQMFL